MMASFAMLRRCRWRCRSLLLLMLLVAIPCFSSAVQQSSEGLGLAGQVARALSRIRKSTRDYALVDDLWFEALAPGDGAGRNPMSPSEEPESPETPAGLARLADAVFDTHRLSWRNAIVPGLDLNVYKDPRSRSYTFDLTRHRDDDAVGSTVTRTFGVQRRRMQMIMLPIMYKLGVITTLLTGLTVLSLKGVTIGVILLMLAVTSVVAKLSKYQGHHYGPSYGPPSHYGMYDRSSQQPQPPAQDKNIHVHVHTAPAVLPPPRGPAAGYYGGPSAGPSGGYYGGPSAGPSATGDNGAGAYYWNRASDEYYDAAAPDDNYYGTNGYYQNYNNRRPPQPSQPPASDAESTANDGIYNRWLG